MATQKTMEPMRVSLGMFLTMLLLLGWAAYAFGTGGLVIVIFIALALSIFN